MESTLACVGTLAYKGLLYNILEDENVFLPLRPLIREKSVNGGVAQAEIAQRWGLRGARKVRKKMARSNTQLAASWWGFGIERSKR